MEHGGGMTWMPGTYDPELNLYYLGTGNPNPVMAGQGRKGDNLWTCSIVALNPDTGKMAWYFQASPHDTHDWDAAETPVLIDGEIDGQPRKLLAQSSRNGYFFVLDRTNGKNILSKPFIDLNWSKGLDAKGQPIGNPDKEPKPDGTLVIPALGGAANWPSPSFDPRNRIVLRQRCRRPTAFTTSPIPATNPKATAAAIPAFTPRSRSRPSITAPARSAGRTSTIAAADRSAS